jgi:cobalt-zinc-cadmium resistance protein CzcA
MLNKIIEFSIRNKVIVGLFTLILIAVGIFSAMRLPIDALPDITNNQVQIITTSPNLATQEVEQIITQPIELAIKSVPKIVELRSVSRFGLSLITVVFEEDVDIYWGRNQLNERLKEAEENIPPGYGKPVLAPVSTGLGEIYQYVVHPAEGYEDQYTDMQLRTIQDWIIIPQLLGTPGVAEVNTLGGHLKQYEVAVQPDRLKSMDITVEEIINALKENNENTGGAYIDKKPNAYYIRGTGMVEDLEEISKIVVKVKNEIPILIRDVAKVQFGSAIRYGATTRDGKGEVVSGMVMMLKGENSAEVVYSVKERIKEITKTLPEGVVIEPFLDRSKLVNKAISTVEKNLLEGALIVVFVLVLLIGNWRAGLIVASVIPLALLFAISLMNLFGVSGNLMSLGAIDFGLIVDGAVIIVESIVHHMQKLTRNKRLTAAEMDSAVYEASSKIRTSAAFGEIIILIVYLPILVLVGIEGKMFGPMAQTVAFAILGAFILSLTYVPMMSALVLSKKPVHKITVSDKIVAFFNRIYQRVLTSALQIKGAIIAISLGLFLFALYVFNQMGGEFIPTLEEGDIATHIIIPPGSSLAQEIETTTKAEKLMLENFPEIEQVVSKIGSAEVPTDPMPMEVADMMVILKDKSEWTSGNTKEELVKKMDEVLSDLPGVTTEFSQPIQMRFNELMTGVRSDVGVKIFGENVDLLQGYSQHVVEMLQGVEGVVDARAEVVTGLPQINVKYNKDKLALYGLNVGQLNQLIRAGFAGEKAGVVFEGEKRFDLVVRLEEESRENIDDLRNMYISLPSGSQIPLEQIADVNLEKGPAQISREDGKRRIIVGFNVRDRDVQSVVEEIQEKIDEQLNLPPGYYVRYAGQFENLIEANKRLSVAVPVALALIFGLLFFTFKDVKQALLIFTAIPLSAIGGVFALWARDMSFSISAGVGFIALFGVAVLNGIVLIGYFNQLKKDGMENVVERIKEGTKVRLRPVLMTAAVASLGFLPMALSTSAGAEVQKPLATVVIGGLISATLLTLIVLPILYYFVEKGMKVKQSVLTLLLLGFGLNLSAQERIQLSEGEALKMALENNLKIKSMQLQVQQSQEKINTSWALPKTELNGSFGQMNSEFIDQNYGMNQVISPFEYIAKRKLNEADVLKSDYQLALSERQLVLDVSLKWNDLLALIEQEKLMRKQDSLYSRFASISGDRYNAGESNLLEKTTALTKQLEFQQDLAMVRMEITSLKRSLRVLLNIDTDFDVKEPLLQVKMLLSNQDSLVLNQHPNLQLVKQNIVLAEEAKKVAQAQILPDFNVGYFIQSLDQFQDQSGTVYSNTPQFQGVTVGLSVPLFFKAQKANVKIANTQIEMEQNHADYLRLQLDSQLDNLMMQLKH